MHQQFQVRPVEQYDGALYPAAPTTLCQPKPNRGWLARRARLGRVALMAVGLVATLGACDWFEEIVHSYGATDGDIAVDYVPPDPPPCALEEMFCDGDFYSGRCGDDGYVEYVDCAAECAARDPSGTTTWSSHGCDASVPDDPCMCREDPSGSPPGSSSGSICPAGDSYCSGAFALSTCVDGYSFTTSDCQAMCREQLGSQDASSGGCNMDSADPCQCYISTPNPPSACTPDETRCVDPETIATCDVDGDRWLSEDCASYCSRQLGSPARSSGCDDARPDNRCGCTDDGGERGSPGR